ncbi:hypothetical protein B5X24_HaOG204638 [Helicoverpa armigera]|nr:hypothetical protein B5X24_HaOG204638 [Helicoverpa armigera]
MNCDILIFKIQLTGRERWRRRTENGGGSQLITRPVIEMKSADLSLCLIVYSTHFIDFLSLHGITVYDVLNILYVIHNLHTIV